MLEPPWTGLGALQQEVCDMQRTLRSKADSHEIQTLQRRIERLEAILQEMIASIDERYHHVTEAIQCIDDILQNYEKEL